MSYLTIGSGDTGKLLSGTNTKGYSDLWRKFLSEDAPYYNAFASPIDALRAGAILERAYLNWLPEGYFTQVKATCKEFDVLTSSIDFAKLEGGQIVDFDELKTIFLPDYISIVRPMADLSESDLVKALKKNFKQNYNQVQNQLLCTGLDSANLCFLSVETYEDLKNELRTIKDIDVTKFRVHRDEQVIDMIKERASYFQTVKNHLNK